MADLLDSLIAHLTGLFANTKHVVVATSGGPDSQVLLDLLARARGPLGLLNLWAVGIDHGLRQQAADELALAAALAARHNVPFAQISVNVLRPSGNLLNNARRARYAALRRFAQAHGATGIALAHTASDQMETILQHLCRGATLRGAAGMPARRGALIRPLLHTSHDTVVSYAAERRLSYAMDPSNSDLRRGRARIRRNVSPTLQSLNPAFAEHFARFSTLAQEDEALLTRWAARRLQRVTCQPSALATLPLAPLMAAPAALGRRMLRLWLEQQQITALSCGTRDALWHAVRQHATSPGQRRWQHGQTTLQIDRGMLWCIPPGLAYARPPAARATTPAPLALPIPGTMCLPGFTASLIVTESPWDPSNLGHFAKREAESVAFDADRLHFGLELRPWRPGDKMRPYGLEGHIKVGNLFTNAKVPQALRLMWPIVTDGDDVAWVVGLRRSASAPLGPQTRRMITLKLDGALLGSAC